MLFTAKLLAALEGQHEHFQSYGRGIGQGLRAYRTALARLKHDFPTAADLAAALREDEAPPGAQPTSEYDRVEPAPANAISDRAPGERSARGLLRLPFVHRFAHHQDARAWAECIQGTTTLAVDGSQLLPWRDASIPVACIQVGLFENPHMPGMPYSKDAIVEILPPDELIGLSSQENRIAAGHFFPHERSALTQGESSNVSADRPAESLVAHPEEAEGYIYSEQIVHLRRLELEVRTIIDACERYAAPASAAPKPVIFYDGSLVVSFALTMAPAYRTRYIAAARALLIASQRTRIPIIAYIDSSHARDVTTMLRRLYPSLPEARHMHDALLWHGQLAWGDRTPAFICARGDVLRSYGEQRADVAFAYLQTTGDRPPARLEFPRWLIEDDQLDRVIDVVRAEVIAGNGYPYAIEAADAVAVISLTDRAEFYRLFQNFTRRYGIDLSFSRKAVSKSHRRL